MNLRNNNIEDQNDESFEMEENNGELNLFLDPRNFESFSSFDETKFISNNNTIAYEQGRAPKRIKFPRSVSDQEKDKEQFNANDNKTDRIKQTVDQLNAKKQRNEALTDDEEKILKRAESTLSARECRKINSIYENELEIERDQLIDEKNALVIEASFLKQDNQFCKDELELMNGVINQYKQLMRSRGLEPNLDSVLLQRLSDSNESLPTLTAAVLPKASTKAHTPTITTVIPDVSTNTTLPKMMPMVPTIIEAATSKFNSTTTLLSMPSLMTTATSAAKTAEIAAQIAGIAATAQTQITNTISKMPLSTSSFIQQQLNPSSNQTIINRRKRRVDNEDPLDIYNALIAKKKSGIKLTESEAKALRNAKHAISSRAYRRDKSEYVENLEKRAASLREAVENFKIEFRQLSMENEMMQSEVAYLSQFSKRNSGVSPSVQPASLSQTNNIETQDNQYKKKF